MKPLALLIFFACSLLAGDVKSEMDLRVIHGSTLSSKIILQTLGAAGQRVTVHRYKSDSDTTLMELSLSGRKAFDPRNFSEILGENGLVLTKGTIRDKRWQMEFDASQIHWNIPAITPDEGSQMEKSFTSNWFTVNQASVISIEAPYGNKWYPDVAVLDSALRVLSSMREFTPREQLTFSLPEGAMYLKVSNANGMKLLKEGMWIEHGNEGR